jgi:hypothetical protein
MIAVIIGNLFRGFSVSWWKGKYNTSHAVSNLKKIDPTNDYAYSGMVP